jgi:hypothetical protein
MLTELEVVFLYRYLQYIFIVRLRLMPGLLDSLSYIRTMGSCFSIFVYMSLLLNEHILVFYYCSHYVGMWLCGCSCWYGMYMGSVENVLLIVIGVLSIWMRRHPSSWVLFWQVYLVYAILLRHVSSELWGFMSMYFHTFFWHVIISLI